MQNFSSDSQKWQERLWSPLVDRLEKEPVVKVVVVHVGTNDLKAGRHQMKYYSSIRMLVTGIREFAPECKILWSTVLPRHIENDDLIEERTKFNESLRMVKRAFADDPKILSLS